MKNHLNALLVLLMLTFPQFNLQAMDSGPAWLLNARQLQPSATPIKLNAAGKEFYGIFTEQISKKSHGVALFLHDANQHPDWEEVIRPMRQALPRFGWSTLSIELPRVPKNAGDKEKAQLLEQASAYILAAQAQLQNRTVNRIVIIGHGLGARMAVDWLSKTPQSSVAAMVLISMADGEAKSGIDSNAELQKVNGPVLDIIGTHESKTVMMAARERFQFRNQKKRYRQIKIAGANKHFRQHEEELVKRIRGWLKVTFKY